jgi:hypothetical protein
MELLLELPELIFDIWFTIIIMVIKILGSHTTATTATIATTAPPQGTSLETTAPVEHKSH